MRLRLLISIISIHVAFCTEDDYTPDENEDLVREINSKAKCWTASLDSARLLKEPKDFEMRLGAFQKEVAVGEDADLSSEPPADLQEDVSKLPRNFDSRLQWPECPSIGKVVDQGPCGGCWATASTAVAADRYCIQNAGQENPFLSYRDLLTCSDAGDCDGGSSVEGYGYMKTKGVPSGAMRDDENWEKTCSPSPFELCNHHQRGTHEICPDSRNVGQPACEAKCQETSDEDYEKDRYFVNKYWDIWSEEEMMNEIYRRGPISVSFTVYKDYYFYMKGVYEHVAGEKIGLHAVKVIGWGYDEDCDLDYWILSNSWDPDWGEDGFIRIRKGDYHCGIGALGAETCSMVLSAELEAKAKVLLQQKAMRNKAEAIHQDKDTDAENGVGFLVWSVVSTQNMWFALAALGVLSTLHFLFSSCYSFKNSFVATRSEKQNTTYNTVPIDDI